MISNQDSFEAFDKLIAATPDKPAMSVVTTGSAVATMSSLQIAEITGKEHKNVLADIRRILEDAGIEGAGFLAPFKMPSGQVATVYNLPRFECDLVVSGYSVKYRAAIIKRWHELEAKAATPRDPMEFLNDPAAMRGLLLTYTEKVLTLETTVSELTPKAEALERIAGTDGLMNITTAAKTLQIPPKRLFAFLDTNGWTYRHAGRAERLPYQSKISQGLMTMKAYRYTNAKTGEDQVVESSLITAKGLAKLAELLSTAAA